MCAELTVWLKWNLIVSGWVFIESKCACRETGVSVSKRDRQKGRERMCERALEWVFFSSRNWFVGLSWDICRVGGNQNPIQQTILVVYCEYDEAASIQIGYSSGANLSGCKPMKHIIGFVHQSLGVIWGTVSNEICGIGPGAARLTVA